MKFLNHDINRTLLGLVISFLIFFIISSLYYEISLKRIASLNNENNESIDKITVNAIMERLNDSDRVRASALIDKVFLEEKYASLMIENEALDKEKIRLKEEATFLKSQLEYQKVKLEGPVAQFMLIQDKNGQMRFLKEKIDTLCFLLKSKNVSTDECS